ncbi:MAG: hypothetical protein Q8P67_16570 [archaeon]|nr:hypothetical protein [archaeon]
MALHTLACVHKRCFSGWRYGEHVRISPAAVRARLLEVGLPLVVRCAIDDSYQFVIGQALRSLLLLLCPSPLILDATAPWQPWVLPSQPSFRLLPEKDPTGGERALEIPPDEMRLLQWTGLEAPLPTPQVERLCLHDLLGAFLDFQLLPRVRCLLTQAFPPAVNDSTPIWPSPGFEPLPDLLLVCVRHSKLAARAVLSCEGLLAPMVSAFCSDVYQRPTQWVHRMNILWPKLIRLLALIVQSSASCCAQLLDRYPDFSTALGPLLLHSALPADVHDAIYTHICRFWASCLMQQRLPFDFLAFFPLLSAALSSPSPQRVSSTLLLLEAVLRYAVASSQETAHHLCWSHVSPLLELAVKVLSTVPPSSSDLHPHIPTLMASFSFIAAFFHALVSDPTLTLESASPTQHAAMVARMLRRVFLPFSDAIFSLFRPSDQLSSGSSTFVSKSVITAEQLNHALKTPHNGAIRNFFSAADAMSSPTFYFWGQLESSCISTDLISRWQLLANFFSVLSSSFDLMSSESTVVDLSELANRAHDLLVAYVIPLLVATPVECEVFAFDNAAHRRLPLVSQGLAPLRHLLVGLLQFMRRCFSATPLHDPRIAASILAIGSCLGHESSAIDLFLDTIFSITPSSSSSAERNGRLRRVFQDHLSLFSPEDRDDPSWYITSLPSKSSMPLGRHWYSLPVDVFFQQRVRPDAADGDDHDTVAFLADWLSFKLEAGDILARDTVGDLMYLLKVCLFGRGVYSDPLLADPLRQLRQKCWSQCDPTEIALLLSSAEHAELLSRALEAFLADSMAEPFFGETLCFYLHKKIPAQTRLLFWHENPMFFRFVAQCPSGLDWDDFCPSAAPETDTKLLDAYFKLTFDAPYFACANHFFHRIARDQIVRYLWSDTPVFHQAVLFRRLFISHLSLLRIATHYDPVSREPLQSPLNPGLKGVLFTQLANAFPDCGLQSHLPRLAPLLFSSAPSSS